MFIYRPGGGHALAAAILLFGASTIANACDCTTDDCNTQCLCGCPGLGPSNYTPLSDGVFPHEGFKLLSHLSLEDLGRDGNTSVLGNDCWGWVDPLTLREYAIFGKTNGTAFIDVTDASNPVYLGTLPTQTGNSAWRDMKVYQNRCYIVSDGNGQHGMQVFDLTRLRGSTQPRTFTPDLVYTGVGRCHNIAINEQTGYAYLVGTDKDAGGLHIVDIRDPFSSTYLTKAGAFSADGYTHDVQVVRYKGPDSAYAGREIAFCSNEDTVTIVDVTNKLIPTMLARLPYAGSRYTHQGWLTYDSRYFIMNDELDEYQTSGPTNTRTYVVDVSDLNSPWMIGHYQHPAVSIDHNLYTVGDTIFCSNYTSGVRVLKGRPSGPEFYEIAYIDTHPDTDTDTTFNGTWSNYPFLPSRNVIISDRQEGLIMVRLDNRRLTAALGLDGYVGNPQSIRARWEVRLPGTQIVKEARNVKLTPDGLISSDVTWRGTYDFVISLEGYLRKNVSNVEFGDGSIQLGTVQLVNGDVDRDNAVTQTDYNLVRRALGSVPGGKTWDPRADVNGNLKVEFFDLGIVQGNIGRQGDL